jgi:hypothetical protein
MPRKAIDYKKVIIYKLVCDDLSVKDLYVGHTTDFTNRKRSHKSNSLNVNYIGYNFKVYKMIRENGGWNNWSMITIEKYPCNDDLEARARERYWYEVLNANMNSQCPTLDLEKRKRKIKISEKKYRDKNKDKIQEYKKTYHEINKDRIKEYKKDYYVDKKDYFQEKHQCLCGGCFTTANKSVHFKTKKHLKYIQENELN